MGGNKYVLAMYDVRGKQEFIFRTNKLQEIVGASWLIRDVFKDYLFPAAKEYKAKGIYSYVNTEDNSGSKFSVEEFGKRINSNEYIGEVVYEGGGNFIVLFKDEDTFKEITYRFTKKVMEEVGTLRVLGTAIEIDDFNDYAADRAKLYKKHRIQEAQESNISPWSCLPIVQVDRKTSQPLVDYDFSNDISREIKGKILQKGVEGKLSKESIAKLLKYYSEKKRIAEKSKDDLKASEITLQKNSEDILDKLVTDKGTDSLLAIVYIDGNNMGVKVQEATEDVRSYEDSVQKLREFSQKTQSIYIDEGTKEAFKGLESKSFRLVVSAGDEINFIVNAHDAFKCAENYLNYLKNKKEEGASACAGIAVFHSHAPYADVYRIAEEACESGKRKMKDAGLDAASFIDFHICQGAIGVSLDWIRKEENGDIISRPWMIWCDGEPGEKNVGITSYKDVKFYLNYINEFARSNVKGLLSAAKEGLVPLQMEINRMYGHTSEKIKKDHKEEWESIMKDLKNDNTKENVRSIFYDIALAYDLWFKKEVQK